MLLYVQVYVFVGTCVFHFLGSENHLGVDTAGRSFRPVSCLPGPGSTLGSDRGRWVSCPWTPSPQIDETVKLICLYFYNFSDFPLLSQLSLFAFDTEPVSGRTQKFNWASELQSRQPIKTVAKPRVNGLWMKDWGALLRGKTQHKL